MYGRLVAMRLFMTFDSHQIAGPLVKSCMRFTFFTVLLLFIKVDELKSGQQEVTIQQNSKLLLNEAQYMC
jgi:hypothetical protein